MNKNIKRHIAGVICAVCVLGIVFCILHMIPYALAGNESKAKLWFVLIAVLLCTGIPCGIAYYFYNNDSHEDAELERMRSELETLSGLEQKRIKSEETEQNTSNQSTKDSNGKQ